MLTKYGATEFRSGGDGGRAAIAFTAGNRRYRLVLALPGSAGGPQQHGGTGPGAKSNEDTSRRSWHKLSLLIRAKLEAVDSGIVTFDEEFLAYMVLPGGRTVFQDVAPAISAAYATGVRTALLGGTGR